MNPCYVRSIACQWVCSWLAFAALGAPYVRQDSRVVVLGNRCLERVIETRPWLRTASFTNKLTGHRFDLDGDEWRIALDSETQTLGSKDFQLSGSPKIEQHPGRRARVEFTLTCAKYGVALGVTYELGQDEFYVRKQLELRPGRRLVNWVEVERLRFSLGGKPAQAQRSDQARLPFATSPWNIRLGVPVYIAGELFAGLEYPAGHNDVTNDGTICLRHYPGKKGRLVTRRAVLGVSPNTPANRVNDWFLRYVDRCRARPVKRSVQWVAYFAAGMSDELVHEKFRVAKAVFADRGVHLDCVLMDSGWTDAQSIMRISPRRPDRLALVSKLAREQLNTALGLHVITSGVKPMVDKDWLAAQGYDLIWHRSRRDGAYCFGDPKVRREFEANLVRYVKEYDIAAYKFDWGRFGCDRADHCGHLPGFDYGTEANTDNFIRVLEALRKANPDIFLFNTGYYSPWWLWWYDAVFSSGGDYNFSLRSCPVFTTCSALCTWRDTVVRGNLALGSPFFPLSSLMHVSPINHWWHQWDARDKDPLDRFTDYVLMSYLRGSQMTEVYLNIAALPDPNRDALAAVMNWAADNDDLLLAGTRFIGGDPIAGQVYGYAHFAPDHRGLIGLRNPHVEPADFALTLDETAGLAPEAKGLVAQIVYPYHFVFAERLGYGQKFNVRVQGHEVLVIRIGPEDASSKALPSGCRFMPVADSAGRLQCRLLGMPETGAKVGLTGDVPAVAVSAQAMRREGSTILWRFSAAVPEHARADAVLWVDRPGMVAEASVNKRLAQVEAPHIRLKDSEEPARTYNGKVFAQRAECGLNAKGPWSMFRVPLHKGANSVELRMQSPDLDRIRVPMKTMPSGPVPQKAVEMRVTGLVQTYTRLHEVPAAALPRGQEGAPRRMRLPDAWASELRGTVRVGVPERFTLRSRQRSHWHAAAQGQKLFVDDDTRILRLPKAMAGARALAISKSAASADSVLSLHLDRAARVVVAFGKPGAAGYLPPQPGWQRCLVGGFAASDAEIDHSLHSREFPPGRHDLFVGLSGAYGVVAIVPRPPNLAPAAKVEVSSTHDPVHLPTLAIDGDVESAWWSINGLPQWLKLDLGTPAWLNRVDLTFYHSDVRYYQYVVQTSTDGKTWEPAADAIANKTPATRAGTTHWFSRRQARFVRVEVRGSSEIAAHITNMAVFDDPLAPSPR